jgi:hypothetical protein
MSSPKLASETRILGLGGLKQHPSKPETAPNRATERWSFLKSHLLSKSPQPAPRASHPGYDLFPSQIRDENGHQILGFELARSEGNAVLQFGMVDAPSLEAGQLGAFSGFLNTGRILWASEEVLAFWAIENAGSFRLVLCDFLGRNRACSHENSGFESVEAKGFWNSEQELDLRDLRLLLSARLKGL